MHPNEALLGGVEPGGKEIKPMVEFGCDGDAFTLAARISLPRPRSKVFAFFADPRNLESLTPPWLRFHILTTQVIIMRVGARIAYRLRVHGLPVAIRNHHVGTAGAFCR